MLVTAGVAVDPQGEIVRMPKTQCAVLDDWIAANNQAVGAHLGSPVGTAVTLYVVLCYRQCATDEVPVPGEPCRTQDQSVAPSRWADDFQLALSFDRPAQPGVEAMQEFAAWLGSVEVSDAPGTFATLAQFEAAVRAAGQITSPLGLLPFGSPLSMLRVHTLDAPSFFRAAYRIWVTELRPTWSALAGGDPPAETRVLLAELGVPVVLANGQWKLNGAVSVNEETRPFLVPVQLAQQWLDRYGSKAAASAAWGQFDLNGATLAASSHMTASQPIATDKTVFLLKFDGWSATANYLVKGAPLAGFKVVGAAFAVIPTNDSDLKIALGGSAPQGVVVRSGLATAPAGFSVEITQVG